MPFSHGPSLTVASTGLVAHRRQARDMSRGSCNSTSRITPVEHNRTTHTPLVFARMSWHGIMFSTVSLSSGFIVMGYGG